MVCLKKRVDVGSGRAKKLKDPYLKRGHCFVLLEKTFECPLIPGK